MKPTRSKNKFVVRKIVREAVAETLADLKSMDIQWKSWPELWAETRAAPTAPKPLFPKKSRRGDESGEKETNPKPHPLPPSGGYAKHLG